MMAKHKNDNQEESEDIADMTEEEMEKVVEDAELVEQILAEKEHYYVTSQGKRSIWADCYSLYNSVIDVTKNPFLANLFIPKIHEAVELLAAFLVGANQSISAEGEGIGDAKKAQVAEKFLDFQWRKVIKARPKIITWVKQAILFGDGIMKLGWEVDADLKEGKVFMEPVSLPDIYMDYYAKHIQDSSSVIHRMVINLDDIIADDRYNDNKHSLITLENSQEENQDTTFGSDDDTVQASTSAIKKVELLERWTDDELVTIAGTGSDFQIIRREDNKAGFKPFVKVPFKTSPLPNRAYNTGSVEPTRKLQRAFNDAINEMFDNVTLINNKTVIMEKDIGITPMSLQRRPGGVIKVNPGKLDRIKWEEVSDIKPSMIELINRLDNEFQQASMVSNLLKGVPGAEFATEAAIGQQNVMTMLNIIEGNIDDGLSELGQMIWELNRIHNKGNKSEQVVRLFEDDKYVEFLQFTFDEIDGEYDLRIVADRETKQNKQVILKRLLEFLAIVSKDERTIAKYPSLPEKVYKRWLEEAGEGDPGFFFEEAGQQGVGGGPVDLSSAAPQGAPAPGRGGDTEMALLKSAVAPALDTGRV